MAGMSQQIQGLRRLPFDGPDHKPAYVPDGGSGVVTAPADALEATALDDAADVLGHSRAMIGRSEATRPELRFTARRLAESLDAVLAVAGCRGERLPEPEGPRP